MSTYTFYRLISIRLPLRRFGKLHGLVSRKSHGNFSGLESCFMFALFASNVKVSYSFEKDAMTDYELTIRQNLLVWTVPLFSRFWFWLKFAFEREKSPGLSKNGPMSISRGNNQWSLCNLAWKGSKITVFCFVLFLKAQRHRFMLQCFQ